MTESVTIHLKVLDDGARAAVALSDICEMMLAANWGTVRHDSPEGERFVNDEVLICLFSSPALYAFCMALRDFVQKQKITVSLRKLNGDQISVSGSGAKLTDLSDLVGFLVGEHTKETKEVRRSEDINRTTEQKAEINRK